MYANQNPNKLIIITFITWFLLVVLGAIMLFGCRTTKIDRTKSNAKIDSTVNTKTDSSVTNNTIDLSNIFSADNVKINIQFDSGSKAILIPKSFNKKSTTIPSSLIESIVNISNQPIKSIEITADKIKDSTVKTVNQSTVDAKKETNINKKENTTIVEKKKESKSATSLYIIIGIVLIVLICLYILLNKFKLI